VSHSRMANCGKRCGRHQRSTEGGVSRVTASRDPVGDIPAGTIMRSIAAS
jgi:hypothetical protein